MAKSSKAADLMRAKEDALRQSEAGVKSLRETLHLQENQLTEATTELDKLRATISKDPRKNWVSATIQTTNEHGLPEPLFEALRDKRRGYKPYSLSVTDMLKGPLQVQIERRFRHRLSEDAMDGVWRLLGNAIHYVVEQSVRDIPPEFRHYETEMDVEGDVLGWALRGRLDLLDKLTGTLWDFKTMSAVGVKIRGGLQDDHIGQLNIYAHLLRGMGWTPTGLKVCGILRDWDKFEQFRDWRYPKTPIIVMDAPLWDSAECEEYVRDAMRYHQWAADQELVHIPICTPEQRWRDWPVFSVVRKGATRATRLLDTELEAYEFINDEIREEDRGEYHVIRREGKDKKCLAYCLASQFCPHAKLLREANKKGAKDDAGPPVC